MRAIPAKVGHRWDPRSEMLTLRVHPRGASISEDYELTATEGRRLAWSLLADLDPDEVEEDLASILTRSRPASAPRPGCTCGASPRAPGGKAGKILMALGSGQITAREAAVIIDRDTSAASAFIIALVRKGLALPVAGGVFNAPTVYAITSLGRNALTGVNA